MGGNLVPLVQAGLLEMTLVGQPTVNYHYDTSSQLTGIDSLIKGSIAGFTMQYDALGRRTALTYPNGVTTNYSYDNARNLLTLQQLNPLNQILESVTYTYDPNGNRMSMDRLNVPVKLPNSASNATYNGGPNGG
jgi:YD repeat-containing protein